MSLRSGSFKFFSDGEVISYKDVDDTYIDIMSDFAQLAQKIQDYSVELFKKYNGSLDSAVQAVEAYALTQERVADELMNKHLYNLSINISSQQALKDVNYDHQLSMFFNAFFTDVVSGVTDYLEIRDALIIGIKDNILAKGFAAVFAAASRNKINNIPFRPEDIRHIEDVMMKRSEAYAMSTNANKYETNPKTRRDKMAQCIWMYPFERSLYEDIKDDLMQSNENGFYEFLKFWKLEAFFPEFVSLCNDRQKAKELTATIKENNSFYSLYKKYAEIFDIEIVDKILGDPDYRNSQARRDSNRFVEGDWFYDFVKFVQDHIRDDDPAQRILYCDSMRGVMITDQHIYFHKGNEEGDWLRHVDFLCSTGLTGYCAKENQYICAANFHGGTLPACFNFSAIILYGIQSILAKLNNTTIYVEQNGIACSECGYPYVKQSKGLFGTSYKCESCGAKQDKDYLLQGKYFTEAIIFQGKEDKLEEWKKYLSSQ